jgi:hypothetical protein
MRNIFLLIDDKLKMVNKVTTQGVSVPQSPVGASSGFPGLTRRSSSDWKNGGGMLIPRHPLVQ